MRTRPRCTRFPLRAEPLEGRELLAANTFAQFTDPTDTSIPHHKGRVSGYVYSDTDGDGARSSMEDGLVGWKVYLDANANGQHERGEKSALTDETGHYEFDLRPRRPVGFGHYITLEMNSRFQNTTQTRHSVLIEKGVHKSNKDFGVQLSSSGSGAVGLVSPTQSGSPYGRVSGRVYLDQDSNGLKAADEERLAGWIVFVDANRNGVRDTTDPQQRTGASGRYEFQLRPSQVEGFGHRVSVVMKDGFENTTRPTRSVLIEKGIHKTNKDFGVRRTNGVSGFVFRDSDGDRTRDMREAKLSGWTVFVDDNGNGRPDGTERMTKTNKNGRYEFQSLPPGKHRIVVVEQVGFDFSVSNQRNATIRSAQMSNEQNFGVQPTKPKTSRPPQSATRNMADISGRVYLDANGNSDRSSDERLLSGWRVFVDANRNGKRDAGEATVRTDASGRYEFTLPVGVYRIGVVHNDNFAFTTNPFRTVDTLNGEDRRRRDFGVIRPSAADAAFASPANLDKNVERVDMVTQRAVAVPGQTMNRSAIDRRAMDTRAMDTRAIDADSRERFWQQMGIVNEHQLR